MISTDYINNPTISLGVGLREILKSYTDKTLYEIRRNLKIQKAGNYGRNELINAIEDKLLKTFREHIYYLDFKRYCILKHITEQDEVPDDIGEKSVYSFIITNMVLEILGEEGETLMIPNDLIDIFKQLDNNKLLENTKQNTELFDLINGCINLYGLIDYFTLKSIIESHAIFTFDDERFKRALKECEALHGMVLYEDNLVYSRCFDNPSYFVDEQAKFKDLEYKEFTREQILLNKDWHSIPETKCNWKIIKILKKYYKCDDAKSRMGASVLIINAKCCRVMEESLAFINFEFGEISIEFLSEFVPLYAMYNNKTAKFALKGYTPNEIMHAQYPKLHKNLTDINTINAGEGKVLQFETKPGRNSKCPCGSGKKYKYCCGRT